jgi:hypothetical protein
MEHARLPKYSIQSVEASGVQVKNLLLHQTVALGPGSCILKLRHSTNSDAH